MNKTKAKGLIKTLVEANTLVAEVIYHLRENKIDNLLGFVFDYTGIAIDDLKKRYNIKNYERPD